MHPVQNQGGPQRPEPEKLTQYQTLMLGRFKVSVLPSNSIFKPSTSRNASFFLRSVFSFGSRHAQIVLEHRTSRVDRRMVKLLNLISDTASSRQAIDRAWRQLDKALIDLDAMHEVKGYKELLKGTETVIDEAAGRDGVDGVDGKRQTLRNGDYVYKERVDLSKKDKLHQAFALQFEHFRSDQPLKAGEYLDKITRLMDLVTSKNASLFVGQNVPGNSGNTDAIGKFIAGAVVQLAQDLTSKLPDFSGEMGGAQLPALRHQAAQLQRFASEMADIEKSGLTTHLRAQGADHIQQALAAIDQAVLEVSTKVLVSGHVHVDNPIAEAKLDTHLQSAVEALSEYESRNGGAALSTNLATALNTGFAELAHGPNLSVLKNVIRGCDLAMAGAKGAPAQDVAGSGSAGKQPDVSEEELDSSLESSLEDSEGLDDSHAANALKDGDDAGVSAPARQRPEEASEMTAFTTYLKHSVANSYVDFVSGDASLSDMPLDKLTGAIHALSQAQISSPALELLQAELQGRLSATVHDRLSEIFNGIYNWRHNNGSVRSVIQMVEKLYRQGPKYGVTPHMIDSVVKDYCKQVKPEFLQDLRYDAREFSRHEKASRHAGVNGRKSQISEFMDLVNQALEQHPEA